MRRRSLYLVATLLLLSVAICTGQVPILQLEAMPPLSHGAFLWKGFDHQWGENGHRIGQHASFITDESITLTPDGVRAQATATMQLSVGVNGDYATPQVLYNFVYSPHIGVMHGEVTFDFRSDLLPNHWPAQSPPHVFTSQLRHDLNQPEMRYGHFNHYVAVLRGFAVDTRCPDGNDSCKTSSWLRDFGMTLDHCRVTLSHYLCEVSFYLHRYQSPDRLKKLPDSVQYHVQVYYTILGGNQDHFTSTDVKTVTTSDRIKSAHLNSQQVTITGICDAARPGCAASDGRYYALGTMGLTGFRYQLNPLPGGSAYLGRYMKRLTFQLADGAYDPDSGTMAYQVTVDYAPAVPIAYDSQIRYQLSARLLQFASADILGDREARGVICEHAFLTMGLRRCRGYFGPDYTYPKFQDTVTLTN